MYRAIIIDDDPVFNMLTRRLVEKNNFHPTPDMFTSGVKAKNLLQEIYDSSDKYVIFLDINMPEMDGWEFLEAIASFADPANTFVVMVTSSIDSSDQERAKKNPFVVKYLSKPVISSDIIELKSLSVFQSIF